MNFIFADPALQREVGSRASIYRYLRAECKVFGFEPILCSHVSASEILKRVFHANPLFSHPTHESGSQFQTEVDGTFAELKQIQGIEASDCLYFSAVGLPQLLAACKWLESFPKTSMPRVIVHLAEMRSAAEIHAIRNHLAGLTPDHLKLVAFDPRLARFVQSEMQYPVEHWPHPQSAIIDRSTGQKKSVSKIAILGHQKLTKGYRAVPDLISASLRTNSSLVFLVHNNAPHEVPLIQEKLRALAREDKRLILSDSAVGIDVWKGFLTASDIILFPCDLEVEYEPSRYCALLNEAIANGIPAIVPANTPLAERLVEFGTPGLIYRPHNAESIASAIDETLTRYNEIARLANQAREKWESSQGAQRIITKILEWHPVVNAATP